MTESPSPSDPENLDDLLDNLPAGLARKVAKHLNETTKPSITHRQKHEALIEKPLDPLPPRPAPVPRTPDLPPDYSRFARSDRYPEVRTWRDRIRFKV